MDLRAVFCASLPDKGAQTDAISEKCGGTTGPTRAARDDPARGLGEIKGPLILRTVHPPLKSVFAPFGGLDDAPAVV